MFCATVLYPWGEGKQFDTASYAANIAPRYAALLGDNCIGFEVRAGRNAPGQPHIPFLCIASFWVRSPELFAAALSSQEMRQLMDEIRTFSDIEPVRQFDEQVSGPSRLS